MSSHKGSGACAETDIVEGILNWFGPVLYQCLHIRDGTHTEPWGIDEFDAAFCETISGKNSQEAGANEGYQYTIGAFLSSVSLNIVSHDSPKNWRHAVLSQFALSGAAIIAWIFLPESPRWHCAHQRETECKTILHKVNGKVEGYDVDEEYAKMRVEVEHIHAVASMQGGGTYMDVFRGTNLVRNQSTTSL